MARGKLIVVGDEGKLLGQSELGGSFSEQPTDQRLLDDRLASRDRAAVDAKDREYVLDDDREVRIPHRVRIGEAVEPGSLEARVVVDRVRPQRDQASTVTVVAAVNQRKLVSVPVGPNGLPSLFAPFLNPSAARWTPRSSSPAT